MKKYLLYLLVFHAVIPISCDRETPSLVETPEEKTFKIINGSLSGSLTEENSPYHVTQGISVDSLHELRIQEGTRIFFDKNTKLIIEGNFSASGTKARPVLFTSYSDSGWGGIIVSGSSSSEFRFCRIEKISAGANDSSGSGGVLIINSDFEMNNCIIENNRAVNGGGLYIINSRSKICNNIFTMNYSEIFGGAILTEESSVEMFNNIFYENDMNYYGAAVVLVENDTSIIQNNIFFNNNAEFGDAEIMIAGESHGFLDTAYNFAGRNEVTPEFISENDFHLKLQSPCRNAGNPSPEFNDHDGTRNDQGAYGGPSGDW